MKRKCNKNKRRENQQNVARKSKTGKRSWLIDSLNYDDDDAYTSAPMNETKSSMRRSKKNIRTRRRRIREEER